MVFKITRGGLFESEPTAPDVRTTPKPKKKVAKVNDMQQRAEQAVARHMADRDRAIANQDLKEAAKVDNRRQQIEQIKARFIADCGRRIEKQRAKEANGVVNPNASIGKGKRRV